MGLDWYEVVLLRAGSFTFRDHRGTVFADTTTAVLGAPGQLAEIAHPAPGGDLDTLIFVSPRLWERLTGDDQVPLWAPVGTSTQIAQRTLIAQAQRGYDSMILEEAAMNLVADLISGVEPARVAAGRPPTERSRRRLVADARAIMSEDPKVSTVRELASRLSCSPHHLSRLFHSYTGMTLGAYRTRLRVNLALELLAGQTPSLADVAAECGFSDQAHLTRTLRGHCGSTPSLLRRTLSPPGPGRKC